MFSLANPFGIAFWGGIGGGFATHIAGMPLVDKLVLLFVGFATGAFAWCVGISALVACLVTKICWREDFARNLHRIELGDGVLCMGNVVDLDSQYTVSDVPDQVEIDSIEQRRSGLM